MPGPLERFRFLDGFMNQSPRIIASIREKGYRFFPSLEAEADTLRRRWAVDREALKNEATAGTLSERSQVVIKELETETGPLLRKLDRIRKLLGGLSTGAFSVEPSEHPIWHEDSAVVAKGNRIAVAIYLTTERLVLVRVEAAAGGKNVRDYKLSSLSGIAPLAPDRPEGAMLVFGNERLALASHTTDHWKKLLARIRSLEFQRDLAPEPLHVESEGESARTTILTPDVIAKAMAESRGKAAAIDERLETPLETLLTEQIPESPPTPAPRPPSALPDFEIIDPEAQGTAEEVAPTAEVTFMVPTSSPSQSQARAASIEATQKAAREAVEAVKDLLAEGTQKESDPRIVDRGPGGHDVLSFDSVFEAQVKAEDSVASRAVQPPPAPASPRPEPAPPPAPRSLAPPKAAPPPSPRAPQSTPRQDADQPAETEATPAAKGPSAQDAVRARMRAEGSRRVSSPTTPTRPTRREDVLARQQEGKRLPGYLLIGIAVILLLAVVGVVAYVIRSSSGHKDDGSTIPTVHGGTGTKAPKPGQAPATDTTPGEGEKGAQTPTPDGTLPSPKPMVTHVMEETMATTPLGPRALILGALPPPDVPEKGSKIPAYDAAIPKYRIVLKNKKDWVVTSYQRNKDRVYVALGEGHVELPLTEIVRIEPAK